MSEENYLTIGQLAKLAGTTVRTIQYYDQMGIMSPAAHGPQNQRLYRKEDLAVLSRIRTLQYLGFSLADISSGEGVPQTPEDLEEVVANRAGQLEEEFKALFEQVATLQSMQALAEAGGDTIEWPELEEAIDRCQAESVFERHRSVIRQVIKSGHFFGAPIGSVAQPEGQPEGGHPGGHPAS